MMLVYTCINMNAFLSIFKSFLSSFFLVEYLESYLESFFSLHNLPLQGVIQKFLEYRVYLY